MGTESLGRGAAPGGRRRRGLPGRRLHRRARPGRGAMTISYGGSVPLDGGSSGRRSAAQGRSGGGSAAGALRRQRASRQAARAGGREQRSPSRRSRTPAPPPGRRPARPTSRCSPSPADGARRRCPGRSQRRLPDLKLEDPIPPTVGPPCGAARCGGGGAPIPPTVSLLAERHRAGGGGPIPPTVGTPWAAGSVGWGGLARVQVAWALAYGLLRVGRPWRVAAGMIWVEVRLLVAPGNEGPAISTRSRGPRRGGLWL